MDGINLELRNLMMAIKKKIGNKQEIYMKNNDVTPMNGMIIGYLLENQNRDIFQKDIETAFRIEGSTTTKILQLMEKKDLIVRESVEHDSRLKKIKLTPKSKKLGEDFMTVFSSLEKELTKGISTAELRIFNIVIKKMKDNIVE